LIISKKKLIIPLIIPFYRSQKTADVQKNFPAGKNKYMPDSHASEFEFKQHRKERI
jgi:hypothetical protein